MAIIQVRVNCDCNNQQLHLNIRYEHRILGMLVCTLSYKIPGAIFQPCMCYIRPLSNILAVISHSVLNRKVGWLQ